MMRHDRVTLHHGDCLDVLRTLPDASVDSVVTDPPYGLGFMGKAWDDLPPGEEWARECLRVLKPGGHLLAFGGTRTWHRLACAVEDAGFEVRDSLAWLFGSGFPKSLNVSKALGDNRCQCDLGEYDHARSQGVGALEQERTADMPRVHGGVSPLTDEASRPPAARVQSSVSRQAGCGPLDSDGGEHEGAEAHESAARPGQPGVEGWSDLRTREGQLHRSPLREVSPGVPEHGTSGRLHHGAPSRDGSVDRPMSAPLGGGEPHQPRPEGQQAGEPGALPEQRGSQAGRGWPVCAGCGKPSVPDGLGTALKPAFEPVVVARKPLVGTVAANVLKHGTGALNIDGCRIEHGADVSLDKEQRQASDTAGFGSGGMKAGHVQPLYAPGGRWPANVVLDGPMADALDQQSGTSVSQGGSRGAGGQHGAFSPIPAQPDVTPGYGDKGGASRFFYVAKAPKRERPRTDDGTAHPTVKPLALMRWLVRLVTPPGGVVLEPFAGSGTTVEACILEGFDCIAIEREADYLPLIEARIARQLDAQEQVEPDLFDLLGEATA